MDDRISSLPDDLLCHILSFLSTVQAVATSVLSKRWRSVWTSVPVRNYRYSRTDKKSSHWFENLVYATIRARDDQQQLIRSFCIKYEVVDCERAEKDVSVWVNTAIQRGIENLQIKLEYEFEYETKPIINLSSNIFNCKTLVVLKLKNLALTASFSSVELPSLKSLHLKRVECEELQCLVKFLYGCPILEDLNFFMFYAHDCSFCNEPLKILPKLVRADLSHVGIDCEDSEDGDILLKAISNVEFMTIKEVEFVDEVFPEFPHLRHLNLGLASFQNSHLLLLMLKNCPKLQSFEFEGSFTDEDVLPYPLFVPECLTLCLTNCYLKRYQGTENELQVAKYIMQNSTYLQSMKICCVSPNPLEAQKELTLCPMKSELCELSFNGEVC